MRLWAIWTVLAVLLCVAGCSDDAAERPGAASGEPVFEADAFSGSVADAMTGPDAPFDLTVGTGRNTHMPLSDGDTLHLELGHQGLQHVLVSIQLVGLPQDRYPVDFQLIRNDGVAVSEPTRVRLPFIATQDGSGAELLGYTLVVLEPALGVGHDAVLRVAVEGPEGGVVADQREVHVEWAPEGWDPDV